MQRNKTVLLLALLACVCAGGRAYAQQTPFTRTQDVIYGRKLGMALTMDVLKPEKPSGIGVLWMVSGGWYSGTGSINPARAEEFLKRGQTVFAIVHGSQPKFTIPEIGEDIARAVRFVRAHAAEYGVDPERLGITGASSGGHLSLMAGARGTEGDPKAKDPVDRGSSRIAAVACFFPPTDFLNYGQAGANVLTVEFMRRFWPAFGAKSSQHAEQAAVAKATSPVTYFTDKMPPTLIIHGDADTLVPLQQAQAAMQRLEELKVPHRLVVREGRGHGWQGIETDLALFAEWFEQHLPPK